MIDMVFDQRSFCAANRAFDSKKLLGDFRARSAGFDHLNDAAQMAAGAVEPFDDRGMAFMNVITHSPLISPMSFRVH